MAASGDNFNTALTTNQPASRASTAATHSVAAAKCRPFTPAAELAGTSPSVHIAAVFGAPLLDLTAFDWHHSPDNLIDIKLLRQYRVLPLLRRDNCLFLAMTDPADSNAMKDIHFHTGIRIEAVVVAAAQIDDVLEKFIQRQEISKPLLVDWQQSELESLALEPVTISTDQHPAGGDEAPIVRFVHKLLLDGIRADASDIHIEPYEKIYRVRFRLDGILQEVARPPISLAGRIASRIKVMAQLDISEKRVPQDGRVKIRLAKTRAIDVRVNILPSLWGEKIVLRLLDPATARLGIDALGFELLQKTQYLQALRQKQGLILITGPTGSGKSVSLYTGLNILNTIERNISTAEDPVELNIEGINQVSINSKSGFGFADALRAFLRQDPDVLMVGEVRDLETAEVAIRASQTGHLVLTTLHTNSAAETLIRLLNMGVSPFNLATSLSLIIAQRLVRKLCNQCKESVSLPEKVLIKEGFPNQSLQNIHLFRAVGCKQCSAGYKGRIGIYEVVPITDSLSRFIMAGASALQLAKRARLEGCASLRQSMLMKVAQGVTTLEEANRVS